MAAAALSSSRGVAGVRATKGLFLVFTLLCLVCLSSSLVNKDQLKKIKEKIQKAQQQLDKVKASLATSSQLMNYCAEFIDPLMGLVKKTSKSLPADFPPLEGLVNTLKDMVEKTKTFIDGENEELGEEIEKKEQKLREMKELIDFIEEQEAEL